MALFLIRRLLAAVGVVILVSFLIFLSLYLAPGGPEKAILGPTSATPETLAQIREQFGLDQPFIVQYLHFLQGVATLDFGRSYQTGESVTSGIIDRLGITVPLAVGGLLVSVIVGLGGGVIAAYRAGRPVDKGIGAAAMAFASIPVYATAILLLFVFGVQLRWFPIAGSGDNPLDTARHLVLPVIALGLMGSATILRRSRAAMVEALARDDVAYARARGVSGRDILFRYVLRHSGVAILTAISVILIFMMAGTAVTETAFGLDGIGSNLIKSINRKDIPMVQGIATVITILVVLVNLITDALYAVIDPRINRGRATA
ncbi:UNVERIFIED_ORG: peptide/nickel transport system permease protein [Paenarthrobacter nicotinovorans]